MPTPRDSLGVCARCGRPIRWATTATGKSQALNPKPDDDGNTVAYRDHTGRWRARVPTPGRPEEGYERRYMPHAATCAAAPRAVPQHRLPPGVVSLAARRRERQRPRPRRIPPPTLF